MKKVWIILSVAAVLAIFAFAVCSGYLVFDTAGRGRGLRLYFVLDHSGEMAGDALCWSDARYIPCGGAGYTEGKTIAATGDGWQINEVNEDDTHTFLVIRSFLDEYLLVREDYEIPTEGEIYCICWNHKTITDPSFCSAVSALLKSISEGTCEPANDLTSRPEAYRNAPVFVGVEGCSVATNWIGYLWETDETWYIALRSVAEADDSGGSEPSALTGYVVPLEYAAQLRPYA